MKLRFKVTSIIYLSFIAFKALAFNGANIEANVNVLPGTIGITGNGSIDSPYNYTALKNNLLTLRYTFTNYGYQPAYYFSVIANDLPAFKAGVIQQTSTCSYTGFVSSLEPGGSCILDINVPKESLLLNFSAHSDNPNFSLIQEAFPLNIIYIYNGNRYDAPTTYVGFSRDWVNPQIAKEVIMVDKEKHFEATINLAANPDIRLISYPITATITGAGLNYISSDSNRNCQITSSTNNSCTLTLKFPKTFYGASEFQSGRWIDVEFTANGIDSKDIVTHRITIKM